MTFTTIRQLSFGHCDPAGMAYFPAYLDMLVGVTEELFELAERRIRERLKGDP